MSTPDLLMPIPPPTLTHHFQGRAANLSAVILEEIFFCLVQHQPNTGSDGDVVGLLLDLHNITQVCRSWRRVALGRHRLWTCIKVRTGLTSAGQLAKGLGLVEIYLARSGQVLPLDITVLVHACIFWTPSIGTDIPRTEMKLASSSMYRFMCLLEPVRHRLRSLTTCFPSSSMRARPRKSALPWVLDNMPELESLTVLYQSPADKCEAGTIDLSASCNKLRQCDISGSIYVSLAEGLVLSSLTSLQFDLDGSCADELVASWYAILRRMPVLKTLTVTLNNNLEWDPHFHPRFHPVAFTKILLPRLEILRLYYMDEIDFRDLKAPYKFLGGLLCPQLKDLTVDCEYGYVPDERDDLTADEDMTPGGLAPFLLSNCDMLERLVIAEDMFYEVELTHALVRCTSLRHLHFNGVRFAENSVLFKELNLKLSSSRVVVGDVHGDVVSRPLCPNLEFLKVTSCFIPSTITVTDVVDMIVSRREGEGSTLQHIDFDDCSLEGLKEDPRMRVIRDEILERCEDEVDQGE